MKKQIIFFLSLGFLCCQNTFCQNDGLTDLKLDFKNDHQTMPCERLFVHTDKNFYVAGDIIWLKIYQLDTVLNQPNTTSKVAYLEILNDLKTVVAKAKIGLNEKGGDGSIELPLTLHSGYFILRAYTNRMKNYGPWSFFEKKITIINPLKTIDNTSNEISHGTVDLFPEGGNLVNAIRSQVAFKITDASGKGVDARGYLLNEKNDTLLQFSPYKFGLGSFDFTPDLVHSYKVVIIFNDNAIVVKHLPPVYKDGYVMHVEAIDQRIKVTVSTDLVPGNQEVFLIAQNHRVVKAAKGNFLSNGTTSFLIDRSELGAGVSELTVFNSEKQPVCERLFFIQPAKNMSLNATASKQLYTTREKVALTITSTYPANVSLSVYQIDSLQDLDGSDITSYTWLESELTGKVESPRYYFSDQTEAVKKSSDLLMLTHGWRRLEWQNKTAPITFLPETAGQNIGCRIKDGKTGKPAKNIQVFLSVPETSYKLYSGLTDDSGIVNIAVKDFYGKGEIILQTNEPDDYKLEIVNPFIEQYSSDHHLSFAINSDKASLLENYSIAMQTQHIYHADSTQTFSIPDIKDTFPFFGKALFTYKLDNYTRFTTMEEVLREYVREINVGVKGGGELKFKLFNQDFRNFYTDNILVVIDGVPIFNTSKIFSVDPLKIRSIDLITKSYVLDNSFFYALASFSSYNGNYEGFDLDPKAIRLDYEGLQLSRRFYSPDYTSEAARNTRVPDFRTTLYWSSSVELNQPIQFFTGDNKGKFLVVVQGMTNSGEPLSNTSSIEVK